MSDAALGPGFELFDPQADSRLAKITRRRVDFYHGTPVDHVQVRRRWRKAGRFGLVASDGAVLVDADWIDGDASSGIQPHYRIRDGQRAVLGDLAASHLEHRLTNGGSWTRRLAHLHSGGNLHVGLEIGYVHEKSDWSKRSCKLWPRATRR